MFNNGITDVVDDELGIEAMVVITDDIAPCASDETEANNDEFMFSQDDIIEIESQEIPLKFHVQKSRNK
jgi:hypothetical protein